ncbi:NADH-quinone oxidoreductase subunit 5 family protein [Aeropyrum camini]|uniref:NADH-quinone oxidoreductase subunit 5 family protein n=1 Tax=Aeropyrum camini TaxID=229980 RepID=UPI000AFCC65E|nr:NADH-quinone oxidoreductase subunit L [Aeropyrum camini]
MAVESSVINLPLMPWSLVWMAPYLAAVVIAVGWLLGVRRESFYGWVSVAGILVSALFSTYLAKLVLVDGKTVHVGADSVWIPHLGVGWGSYFDGLSAIMSLVVSWISLLIAVYSIKYMEGDWGYGRYFFMISFFVGSMMLLVVADNLVLMFVGWEGTGIASYALIGHWYTDEEDYWVGRPGRRVLGTPMFFEPSHSAVRAILFTRVGDIGFLIGIAALYITAGTLSIPELASTAHVWLAEFAGQGVLPLLLLVFTLGALAKSAQIPFHEWLVTAMTGPTPVSALIHAATMVKAGVYFVLRFTPIIVTGALAVGAPEVLGGVNSYFTLLAWIAVLTALLLSLMALVSDELKLILAFSTASQLGYMILAAAAGGIVASALAGGSAAELAGEGVAAGLGHLVSHAVFKAALFLAAGWVIHAAHSRFIDHMGGFARYMRLTALAFWLSGLSLAGVPPLSGFFTKEEVVAVAYKAEPFIGGLAALTALLTAAYTARMIIRVFHLPPYEKGVEEHLHEAPPLMLVPYTILAFASLVLGLWFTGFFDTLSKAVTLSLAVEEALVKFKVTSLTYSVVAGVLASIALVAGLYMVLRVDFRRIIREYSIASAIHGFLYDRMYFNAIVYIVVLGGGGALVAALQELDLGIDLLYHSILVAAGGGLAFLARKIYRGRTDYIIALYIVSLAFAALAAYAAFEDKIGPLLRILGG